MKTKNIFLTGLTNNIFFLLCFFILFALSPALAQHSNVNQSINQFGLELFRDLSADGQTEIAISPFSISSALAMTLAGAEGETRDELKKALKFEQDDQSVAVQIMSVSDSLTQSKEALAMREGPQVFDWSIANRLFGEESYKFLPDYLSFVSKSYRAPLEKVSFKTESEKSRLKINDWVEELTKDKIKNLIPERAIDSSTRLALVNALYLKAAWQEHFPKESTRQQPFYVSAVKTVNPQTMNQTGYFGYKQFDSYQLISVPYMAAELRFGVILPNPNHSVATVLSAMKAEDFIKYSKIEDQRINLYLPKFKISTDSISLKSALKKMSVNKAFDSPEGSADFSKIGKKLPDDYLYLSDVFHKVFVQIDEEGTEAAAATAAIIAKAGAALNPQQPKEIRVDRPFIFFIQHVPSSTILFVGAVREPRDPS